MEFTKMGFIKHIIFGLMCITTTSLLPLDMTQDRPLVGMSPTPDDFYLPPNNPPSLRKFHCTPCKQSSGGSCFNRWRNRYDCFPCRKKWCNPNEATSCCSQICCS